MKSRKLPAILLVLFIFWILSVQTNDTYKPDQIKTSVQKGVDYIYANQLDSGGFELNNLLTGKVWQNSPYPTALVLHSVNHVKNNSKVDQIKTKGTKFLLSMKENNTFWRFNDNFLLDIDDTLLSMYTLSENGIIFEEDHINRILDHRNGEGLFKVWVSNTTLQNKPAKFPRVTYLGYANIKKNTSSVNADYIKANLEKDKLYYSWLLDLIKNNKTIYYSNIEDVACEENLSALAFFSYTNKSLDKSDRVCDYVSNNMLSGNYTCCVFCSSPTLFFYLYTKTYKDAGVTCLQDGLPDIEKRLLESQDQKGCWGSSQDTALAAISLINIGYKDRTLDKAVSCILSLQKKDGSWDPDLITASFESRVISTSLSLEALAKYLDVKNK